MTYTYAIMEVSRETFEEILRKMQEAGYEHAIHAERSGRDPVIDMHGIALAVKEAKNAGRARSTRNAGG
jgi:hypothetical protein